MDLAWKFDNYNSQITYKVRKESMTLLGKKTTLTEKKVEEIIA